MNDEHKKIDLREDIIPYTEEEARASVKTLSTTELLIEFSRLKTKLKCSIDGLSFVIAELRERMERNKNGK